jgi:hypothetical protein
MMERFIAIFTMALAPLVAVSSAEPVDLRRNPFVPTLTASANRPGADSALQGAVQELKLKGILLTGRQPLVNFGGHIMTPGEEVAGYRLVAVREGEAVFNRNGQILTMSLYENPED